MMSYEWHYYFVLVNLVLQLDVAMISNVHGLKNDPIGNCEKAVDFAESVNNTVFCQSDETHNFAKVPNSLSRASGTVNVFHSIKTE